MRERTFIYHATEHSVREESVVERAMATHQAEEQARTGTDRAKAGSLRTRRSTASLGRPDPASLVSALSPDQIRVEYNTTPLHDAAAAGLALEVERLLRMPEAPAWVARQDPRGWRPLHYAALVDDECVVELSLPITSVDMGLQAEAEDPQEGEGATAGAGGAAAVSRSTKAVVVYHALRRACLAEHWGDVKCIEVSYKGSTLPSVEVADSVLLESFLVSCKPYRPLEAATGQLGRSGTAASLRDAQKGDEKVLSAVSSTAYLHRTATPDLPPPAEGAPAPLTPLPEELSSELAKAVRGTKSVHVELARKMAAFVSDQGRPFQQPQPKAAQPAAAPSSVLERRNSRLPGIPVRRGVSLGKDEAAPGLAEQVVAIDPVLYGGSAKVLSQRDSLRCVHALIDSGCDVNCRDLLKATPLHKAVANGKVAVACALIMRGAQLDAADAFGDTPLHRSAWNSQQAAAQLLLGYGCPVDVCNHSQETPLHYAALTGNLAMMRLMLEFGASVLRRTDQGLSTLHVAVRGGSRSAIEATKGLFQERGILWKDAVTTVNGDNPIHIAVRAGHLQIVEWMLQKGFGRSMARLNKFGDTPAGTAVRLAKKFKAKGSKGAKPKKGGKAKKGEVGGSGAASRPQSAARVGQDGAASVGDPAQSRPGTAVSGKKPKAGKKGKVKAAAKEGPAEPLVDTDVPLVPLDSKRVEALLEAAEWMSKKEKGYQAECTAADKAREIPLKKK
ncbi:hypothetical protein T492DRAFT_1066770 [Pavlovales sp. CCMP2436]|nr:hypothetical protein T492DRAFT_1066770 [Pavlovales sp. CCMP2436]|mmetsp:Transcript_33312/g.83014  ORF Transcript_33312/g.83014 Transcript_33312/m.83014 type:complete len:730 (+) Transcript_33312:162-2351(+)